MKSKISVVGRIIVFALIAASMAVLFSGCSKHVSKSAIVNEFNNNKSVFNAIATYMKDTNEDGLNVERNTDNTFIVTQALDKTARETEIKDKKLDVTFQSMFNLKFDLILNDENGVFFIRYADKSYENGIVFSIDGNKPTWSDISKLEKVEGDYYYYEAKY